MKQTLIIQTNEGEEFLRGEHPDTRTNRQWVQFMNRKFPELQWGMKQREKKAARKKKETSKDKKHGKRASKKKIFKRRSSKRKK